MNSQQLAVVVPPGVILKREMDERGWSQADLAEILDRPIQVVNQILKAKKAITSTTARELEDATSISAETWLNLESLYRLSLNARSENVEVSQRAELFSRSPVADMRRRGWVRNTRDISKLKQDVLKLLRIDALSDKAKLKFAARKSTRYDDVLPEQEAWCCRAFQIAEGMRDVPKFSKKKFVGSLDELRNLGETVEGVARIPQELHRLGIRFLILEHLPRTKIDGAAFWLNGSRPVVVLSLRYARIDYFLFTLFHELMHIRHQDALSLDNEIMSASAEGNESQIESRANKEAAALLVPPEKLSQFLSKVRRPIAKGDILRFASSVRIHPGVVLGQLQHRSEVGWSACRELLVPVRDQLIDTSVADGWGRMKT